MMESEKQNDLSSKIRIKPPQRKMLEKNTSSSCCCYSSSTWNLCGECDMLFSSTKALFGHLRIRRKNNKASENTIFSSFEQAKHSEVMVACTLMKWICGKIERQRKMKMKEATSNQFDNYQSLICEMMTPSMLALQEKNTSQCEKSSRNKKMNVGVVVEMAAPSLLAAMGAAEMEIHQCDKCDKVFNSGQAFGGHKRAHYTGPPLCRLGNNGKSHWAVYAEAAEVVVHGFHLNEPEEEVFF